MPSAEASAGWYLPLKFGDRVILEMVRGNPQTAVITGRLWDGTNSMPDAVAGVQTGAVGAQAPQVGVPAPMWQFLLTGAGQLLAIETGVGGDFVVHVGTAGGAWVKVGDPQAIHLDGKVHLGAPPTTPPAGASVGPAGTQVPGTPMVPRVPVPPVPPVSGGGPAPIRTVPDNESIVRAKDAPISDATIDPIFWTWLTAVDVLLKTFGLAAPTPLSLTSDHRTAAKHTASD